ncbi:protein neprosin-like [Miscanthus floridulus]|uniref:protein neprosin-like n=1 Tax=Miscanthus floridulus TaxID=154761 RepID=UPI003458910B
MAATRAYLVALVVALAFLFLEDAAAAVVAETSGTSVQRRQQVHSLLRRLNKPHLASFESPDGDIIDCVDIYKQPAFDDPLLENHTIQMRPSDHPKGLHDDSKVSARPITQTWHQNGKCPENTIPIRRIKEEDVLRASSIGRYGKKMPRSIPKLISVDDPVKPGVTSGHKYAIAAAPEDKYYGTKTNFNLWQPTISKNKDFSLAQLWISKGSYSNNDLNTIEVGWQVYPELYRDSNTRIFIYWTRDGYQTTGCYNLNCPGFIQTNNQFAIGGSISPVSSYGGSQFDIDILIWKDPKGGNWWLQVGSYVVGYWPSSIFSYLADSASSVMWGGEVSSPNPVQTSTQMGSGHFPEEGFGKASYIRNIQVVGSSNILKSPDNVDLLSSQQGCYNVQNGTNRNWGTYIYYGGPGKNPNCVGKN